MPIVRVTPHEEKHAGFSYMRSQSTTTPNMYPLVTLRWGGVEKRDKKIFSTTLRPTNRITAPGMGMFLVRWVSWG